MSAKDEKSEVLAVSKSEMWISC